jgi:hypothetical protein
VTDIVNPAQLVSYCTTISSTLFTSSPLPGYRNFGCTAVVALPELNVTVAVGAVVTSSAAAEAAAAPVSGASVVEGGEVATCNGKLPP